MNISFYLYLRPPPPPTTPKKSIFVKKIEIEIMAWEDSPRFALSETLWLSIKYPFFGRNF
jgi:hypothetical protein